MTGTEPPTAGTELSAKSIVTRQNPAEATLRRNLATLLPFRVESLAVPSCGAPIVQISFTREAETEKARRGFKLGQVEDSRLRSTLQVSEAARDVAGTVVAAERANP